MKTIKPIPFFKLEQDRLRVQFPKDIELSRKKKAQCLLSDIHEQLVANKLDTPYAQGLPWWIISLIHDTKNPFTDDETLIFCIQQLSDVVDIPQYRIPHIQLESSGTLNAIAQDAFFLKAHVWESTQKQILCLFNKNIWYIGDEPFLMPLSIAIALEEILNGAPTLGRSLTKVTQKRRLWWSQIYQKLKIFSLEVDDYLKQNETFYIDEWKPILKKENDNSISLQLETDDISANEITPILMTRPSNSEYTIRKRNPDGSVNQSRMVLSPKAQQAVQQFKVIRQHWSEAEPRLLDAPESLLKDGFDLRDYSERVIGLEVHVYRLHNLSTSNSNRITLKDGITTGEHVLKLTPEEEIDLSQRLQEAGQRGQHYIRFKGSWVRVPSSSQSTELFKQGQNRKIGVLQILENIETNTFQQGGGEAGLANISSTPPQLNPKYNLMPYQIDGFKWLAAHTGIGTPSTDHGLLADDMGLGKTLQTLSVLSLLKEQHSNFCCLLIAPASLLVNWQLEANKFFPNRFKNIVIINSKMRFNRKWISSTDMVLCSYESLRSQQLELGVVEWTIMVTDESHRFKNPSAQTTRSILAMQSSFRIALSGTPVQNSLVDLWSQFDWLCPGFLGELKTFKKTYKDADAKALSNLNKKLSSRFLRRTKEDVLKDLLPSKQIHRIFIDMSPKQQALYDAILRAFANKELVAFSALHQLKRVCTEPSHLSLEPEFILHPKLKWLKEVLETIHQKNEKAIVFAEWYSLQGEITTMVQKYFGISPDILNGQVDTSLRLGKVDRFNSSKGFNVMLLSPKAAGVGLNIVGANHVVHFTRHWNPALENQATDRAYRIGQTKAVNVYLPIVKHKNKMSIEEHIDKVLSAKTNIAEQIIMITDIKVLQRDIELALLKEV